MTHYHQLKRNSTVQEITVIYDLSDLHQYTLCLINCAYTALLFTCVGTVDENEGQCTIISVTMNRISYKSYKFNCVLESRMAKCSMESFMHIDFRSQFICVCSDD